jgi:hypothetical protein
MLKRIIVASLLTLFSIGPASAGGAATLGSFLPVWQSPGVSTPPGFSDAVQACEAQMHQMAELNKTLGANYSAGRVHDECIMSTREAVASK